MIYFLMGLQNVPKELYECATLDGASSPRQFFSITIPLLAPVLQMIVLLSVMGTMRINDVVIVMTNGQPGGTTEVAMSHILKLFFSFGSGGSGRRQYGYGSALAIIMGVILAIMTIIYLNQSKRMKSVY
jgi:raffinose/stachyose/melibiose transport system permease protein